MAPSAIREDMSRSIKTLPKIHSNYSHYDPKKSTPKIYFIREGNTQNALSLYPWRTGDPENLVPKIHSNYIYYGPGNSPPGKKNIQNTF